MRYFSKETFSFLKALSENNNREWFAVHRQEYENLIRTPSLAFISDMCRDLPSISPHFIANPRKAGGSLMRIHRDTRFSKDKTPYKVNIGIQFRHKAGKDIHAPGYYVHIAPDGCFVGVGMWHPEADALFKIREAIVKNGDAWVATRDNNSFRKNFILEGEKLSNAPRGFARNHPLVEDLKRKDFICLAEMNKTTVTSNNFRTWVVEHFRQANPFMRFLCNALAVGF